MFGEIKKIICCYLLASSGATVYRIGIWFFLGYPAYAASWIVSLIFNAVILNAFFKDECKEILKTLRKKR